MIGEAKIGFAILMFGILLFVFLPTKAEILGNDKNEK